MWPHLEASYIAIFCFCLEDSELVRFRCDLKTTRKKYELPGVWFELGYTNKYTTHMKAQMHVNDGKILLVYCMSWRYNWRLTIFYEKIKNPVWCNAKVYPGGHKRVSVLVPTLTMADRHLTCYKTGPQSHTPPRACVPRLLIIHVKDYSKTRFIFKSLIKSKFTEYRTVEFVR